MLQFDWPLIFWLAPLPLLVYLLFPKAKREDAAILVPFYNDIATLEQHQGKDAFRHWPSLIAMTLIWLCTLTAAAGPKWIGDPIRLPTSARDLLIAVDISDSMQQTDMVINNQRFSRFETVKKVVGDFVERRQNDRLGLVLFGTQAYLQAPLTFDRKTVDTFLQESQLGFAGVKTAIGDAIGLSTKRLMARPASSRVLILLTDGANTAGAIEPLRAAELAAQAQIKIYTVGVGANELTLPGFFGGNFGARTVNPSMDLDEPTLIAIAEQTGGKYFRARNVEELESIYAQLDMLEPIEQKEESYRPIAALFYYPLTVAFFISFLLAIGALRKTQSQTKTDNRRTLQQTSSVLGSTR